MANRLILGVGNPFRRDDGIGPAVINALQADPPLPDTDVLEGGTDGFALLDHVQHYDRVLVIDAVNMGLPPGTVRVFAPADANMTIHADALSTHGFGLAEMITLMERLQIRTDLHIIGIQPKEVSFGQGLSPEVAAKLDTILKLVHDV
jgi:hydrogenase maturation protease